MTERTSPRSPVFHQPPLEELTEEEAIRQLLEGIDAIEIPDPFELESSVNNLDLEDEASVLRFEIKEYVRLYRISPNLLRSYLGFDGPVNITNGVRLLGLTVLPEKGLRSQLFQIIKPKELGAVVFEGLIRKDNSLDEKALTSIIDILLGKGIIKKISPEEGAALMKDPFPIEQMGFPVANNATLLEWVRINDMYDEYKQMLHDPHLNIEIQVAVAGLCAESSTFMNAQLDVLQSLHHDLKLQCSQENLSLEVMRKQEEKLKEILTKYGVWANFFVSRRKALINQYQNRPVKDLAPSQAGFFENPMQNLFNMMKEFSLNYMQEGLLNPKKRLEKDMKLYQENLPLLRLITGGEIGGGLIVDKDLFPLLGSSPTGYIKFKDKTIFERWLSAVSSFNFSEINRCLEELTNQCEPIDQEELDREVEKGTVLTLRSESLEKNISILEELKIEGSDPLYSAMSKDPYLEKEIELARIGVCIKLPEDQQAFVSAQQEIQNSVFAGGPMEQNLEKELENQFKTRLGSHKECYNLLLVETLKEQYKARLEK